MIGIQNRELYLTDGNLRDYEVLFIVDDSASVNVTLAVCLNNTDAK